MGRQINPAGALQSPYARQSPRRGVSLEAHINTAAGQSFSGQVQNISASGALIHSSGVALEIGAAVEFVLHCQASIQPVELRIPATVVRLESDGVALRFGRYSSVVYTELIEVIYNNGRGA